MSLMATLKASCSTAVTQSPHNSISRTFSAFLSLAQNEYVLRGKTKMARQEKIVIDCLAVKGRFHGQIRVDRSRAAGFAWVNESR